MSVEWRVRSEALTWSNPVARWWSLLTLVSGANIAIWLLLYREFHTEFATRFSSSSSTELMLLLSAAYVFGCAFRSLLPRADVQRICLFDTWLSSVVVGRSVATVAELCFAAQWTIVLLRFGTMTGSDTVLNVAFAILPFILIAEGFSWYAVLTTDYRGSAIENSIWAATFAAIGIALARLLPDFGGSIRIVLGLACFGIAGYVAFLLTVDVPMYVGRWREKAANGPRLLRPLEGLYDASTRWTVARDLAAWKDEIPWMSLYFSAAVWSSLALCVFYALENQ
jgi:hypothetical protein